MEPIEDIGRWALMRSHGSFRILYGVQALVEDIEGAIDAQQWDLAVYQARELVFVCTSIHSLKQGGEPLLWPGEYDRFHFNPFYGLENDAHIEEAFLLVTRGWQAFDQGDASIWLKQLKNLVKEAEAALELGFSLPVLRSPEGLSIALRVFGAIDDFATQLGLPSVVPEEWVKKLEKNTDGS